MPSSLNPLKTLAPVLKPVADACPGAVWLVGGVLRDALLGRPLRDVDLAVKGDALKAARRLAAALKAKPFPLDEKRGIYRVVQNRPDGARVFDFSRLQGKTLEQDLKRRDFTINALALPLGSAGGRWPGGIVDLGGGLKDLRSRRIRVMAETVLKDDPLRLLRAFRFAAELDFSVDPETLAAIKKHRARIAESAPERVRDELLKILAAPQAAGHFRLMDKAGLLAALFPEAEEMRRTAHDYYGKEGVLGHSLDALASFDKLMQELDRQFPEFAGPLKAHLHEPVSGYPRYALLKLAEFLHDVGKPATAKVEDGKLHFYGHEHVGMKIADGIGARLRLSGEESRSLSRLVNGHMRPGNLGHQPVLTDRAIYRFYRDLEGDALGMLIVALADHFTYLSDKERRGRKDPVYRTIHRMIANRFLRPETVSPPKIVDGRLLMRKLKLPEGPGIGRLLSAVREAQAAGKVKTQAQALALAQKLAAAKDFQPAPGPSRRKEEEGF